jgi:hypothetical protein
VADVPSGLSLTPPQGTKHRSYSGRTSTVSITIYIVVIWGGGGQLY